MEPVAYVGNDPVNFGDPAGLLRTPWGWVDCGGGGGCTMDDVATPCSMVYAVLGAGGGDIPGAWPGSPVPTREGGFCTFGPSEIEGGYGDWFRAQGGSPQATKPQIELEEVDECTQPNGTGVTPGMWTLEVEYQVLLNGRPLSGNNALSRNGV